MAYLAQRAGELPPAGTPTVGGVALPAGDRRRGDAGASLWTTTDYLERPAAVAARLAAAFPATGLWPVGWSWESEGPDAYAFGAVDLAAIDAVDAGQVLRAQWAQYGFDPAAFEGLADPSQQRREIDAFGLLDSQEPWAERPGRQLVLASCTRPADALMAIGFEVQRLETTSLCAVLRSWEDRFGAVLVDLSPSSVTFAAHAPPVTNAQARRLAAEIAAVASTDELFYEGGIDKLAARLLRDTHWQMSFEE